MQPDSIAALATGRKASNLSRTLGTMFSDGLMEMQSANQRQVRPVAKATGFRILTTA